MGSIKPCEDNKTKNSYVILIQFNLSHAPACSWYDGLEESVLSYPNWGLNQTQTPQ